MGNCSGLLHKRSTTDFGFEPSLLIRVYVSHTKLYRAFNNELL